MKINFTCTYISLKKNVWHHSSATECSESTENNIFPYKVTNITILLQSFGVHLVGKGKIISLTITLSDFCVVYGRSAVKFDFCDNRNKILNLSFA